MALKGVLLDIDGTLVLSNDAHAQAWVEAFATYGYEVPFEKVRPLIGMGGDKVIPKMVPELNHEEGDGKAISQKRKELIINKFGSTLAPTQGSRDLILRMKQEGLKLLIATSATSEELSTLLQAAQVDDLLDEATTSSDSEASKPSPEPIQAALKKIGMEPDQVLMLADTPYDVEAAKLCGVDVIAFRSGDFTDEQLAEAIAIYDHPAALLADYDNSALAAK